MVIALLIVFSSIVLGTSSCRNYGVEFEAQSAPPQLVADVKDSVSIIDSYITTRGESSYLVHVLVDKDVSFEPVKIQLIDTDAHTIIETLDLTLNPSLSCARFNSSVNARDPYSRYVEGKSVAFEAEWSLGHNFPYYPEKSISLLIKTDDGLFLVKGLSVSNRCTWLVE